MLPAHSAINAETVLPLPPGHSAFKNSAVSPETMRIVGKLLPLPRARTHLAATMGMLPPLPRARTHLAATMGMLPPLPSATYLAATMGMLPLPPQLSAAHLVSTAEMPKRRNLVAKPKTMA
jgi:hypothetical protein